MSDEIPLTTLLAQLLIAFAIEFDNSFEQEMSKTYARPFGVSIVMWSNFMQFVREEGTRVSDIVEAGCIPKESVVSVIGGMERWGYVTVDHDPATGVPPGRKGFGSGRGVKLETVIYPSMTGKLALDRWRPLAAEIESRWKARFGESSVEGLRDALAAVQSRLDRPLPHFLPIVFAGMFARHVVGPGAESQDSELPALLSRVLLALTLEIEEDSDVSLPVGDNVLRVVTEEGIRERDIPLAAGVSKEAVSMSMTTLTKGGYVALEPHPSERGKIARITPQGTALRQAFADRRDEIEKEWDERFGLRGLRAAAEEVLVQTEALSAGLVTPPGGWRDTKRYKPITDAFVARPREALPRYPMVLHRGGWPDGS